MSRSLYRSWLSKLAGWVVSLLGLVKESDALEILVWWMRGKPVPPPSRIKQRIVKSYLRKLGLTTVVETGTYLGEMIRALQSHARKIYSVELDPNLHRAAQERFRNSNGVRVLQGDSIELLPQILAKVQEPALFWLDAHYSGGVTARGDVDTPIMQELAVVFERNNPRDVILIDDARLFIGLNDYPTIEQLKEFIRTVSPDSEVTVEMDIIRILRPTSTS